MRNRHIIETLDGQVAGYVEFVLFPKADRIREIAVLDGQSVRDVCWFVTRHLIEAAGPTDLENGKKTTGLSFNLGRSHPAYDALDAELDEPRLPYAWYIRVLDLHAWIDHIDSVIEKRIRKSVMAGYSGELRLNFYESQLKLSFENGLISDIGTYEPSTFFDGDAFFPGMTFLQLLFGYRSFDELKYAYPDCFTDKNEPAILLPILFPKHPSFITMLS
jgi:hypothetical protein